MARLRTSPCFDWFIEFWTERGGKWRSGAGSEPPKVQQVRWVSACDRRARSSEAARWTRALRAALTRDLLRHAAQSKASDAGLAARARGQQDEERGVRPQDAPSRPHCRRLLVAGAAAVLVLAGVGFVVLLTTGSKPTKLAGRVQIDVQDIVRAGLEAVGVERPEAPSPPAATPPAGSVPRGKRGPSFETGGRWS